MKLSALLAPLIARKADHDAIMDVVLAFEAEQLDGLTKRRENDAKRQAEKRRRDESHVMSRDVTVTVNSHASASPAPDLENKQTNKQENKRERATRLPTDWQTPEEWIDEAIAAGLTRAAALTEANRMKNWSLSDRNGAKLDWHATWRNWYLRALESQAKATGPPKKVTVASMWRDEGRKLGILPDEHPHEINGRLDASLGDRPAPGSNFARRIAGAGSG